MLLGICSHVVFLCLVLQTGSATGQAPTFHCSKNGSSLTISGETDGDIYTRYEGDVHYQNNQNCEWIIDAGEGRRISISVVSSDLQWAPAVAICHGYDHVSIKDGTRDSDESVVLIWCGQTVPVRAVSRGRYLRVEFMSDNNNPYQYAGVQLKFQTFASTDCPPSWVAPPGSEVCFTLLSKAMEWSTAQKECNSENSNLASFMSEEELKFVVQTYGSPANDLMTWIGLNDKESFGSYKWIDEQPFSVNKFRSGHQPDQYRRCVALHFQSQQYLIHDCIGFKSRPLCKANKGRHTPLFPVPQESNDDTDTPTNHLLAIGVSLGILIILFIIGVIVCCHCRAKHAAEYRQRKNQKDTRDRDVATSLTVVDLVLDVTNVPGRHLRDTGSASHPTSPVDPSTQFDLAAISPPSSQMIAPPTYEDSVRNPTWASNI